MRDEGHYHDAAAAAAGADQAPATGDLTAFIVGDMTCSHCVGTVKGALERALPGRRVTVDLASRRVTIAGREPGMATVAAQAIRAVGYTPQDTQ
jgi:copper chaperone